MIEPFLFIRVITLTLATFWTLRALWRLRAFLVRWQDRLARWGIEKAVLRRAALRFALRATVLDPVNLALMLVLIRIWTLHPE